VTLLLIFILVMDALGQFTWIKGVANATVLPVLVIHKLALKVKSVVDIGEAELNIRMLG
jgi:hypothetical protein